MFFNSRMLLGLAALALQRNSIENKGDDVMRALPWCRWAGFLAACGLFLLASRAAAGPINYTLHDLGTLGGHTSLGRGINSAGQVVGTSSTSGLVFHAFRTAANSPINPATDDLGTLGGTQSGALGINSAGQVVGDSFTSGGARHAFRTAANSAINPATDDLGTLGGTFSTAAGINSAGRVVGNSTTSGGVDHAFLTAANSAINPATDDLGTLGGSNSNGFGINSAGQVVGESQISGDADVHAFLFDAGAILDLNNLIAPGSGFTLIEAFAINDGGQIVGFGTDAAGNTHAFRLDPVSQASAVPEPCTLTLVLVGLGSLVGTRLMRSPNYSRSIIQTRPRCSPA